MCLFLLIMQVVRHVGDATVVRLPSNQDIMIDSRSQCVLGNCNFVQLISKSDDKYVDTYNLVLYPISHKDP